MATSVAKRIVEQAAGSLPSPTGIASGIASKILQLAQQLDTSIKDIAFVTSPDPTLSGRLLKFVNLSQAGLAQPVVSVEVAVSMLGIRVVKQLALGISVLSNTRNGPSENIDYDLFWSKSLATAFAARYLFGNETGIQPEEAFVLDSQS